METISQIIHCLYLEDEPASQETYRELIELAWESQNTGIHLKLDLVESPEKAIHELRANPQKYGLFIADLLFGPTGQDDRGLMAIEVAKQVNSKIAVLAFSITDKNTLAETAKSKGADDFYSKLLLTGKGPSLASLGATLVRLVSKKQPELIPITPIKQETYQGDLQLAAVIEVIGPEVVSRLVAKVVQSPCAEIRPFFVRAGLSGASVIRVDCSLEVDDQNPYVVQSLLLKISRDEKQISSELSKIAALREFPSGSFIPFAEKSVVNSGEWYAIAVEYKNALTLLDWLIKETNDRDTIERSLKTLFLGGGLASVYSRFRRREGTKPTTFIWETALNPSRRARIQLASEELFTLATTHGAFARPAREMLENFVRSRRLGDIDEERVDFGVSVCTSHGDLHGRNILIDENNHPSLIDPANIDTLHWAADVARLIVDLIVSGWDVGDKSHEWEKLIEWVDLSRSVVRGDIGAYVDDGESSNSRIYMALRWLREKLWEIHKVKDNAEKPEWEFKLALAVEFMRAAYRLQDLPSPKRVLGLIAASEALGQAAANLKESV
jgi:hypothetical protein